MFNFTDKDYVNAVMKTIYDIKIQYSFHFQFMMQKMFQIEKWYNTAYSQRPNFHGYLNKRN